MKKILLFLFLSATIFSCKVTWVPTKSATALDMVQQIQQDANEAFDRPYYYDPAYSSVSNQIDSLIAFDKARVKSGKILVQDKAIKTLFDEFRNENKVKEVIELSERDVYKSYFKSVISPRIISENSLK